MNGRRNPALPGTAVSARSHTFLQFIWLGNRHSTGSQGISFRAMFAGSSPTCCTQPSEPVPGFS